MTDSQLSRKNSSSKSASSVKSDLGFTFAEGDAFKGILILFIVLGHNTQLTSAVPVLFGIVYTFHVRCFLLLPFVMGHPKFEWGYLRDRAVRYLVPFLAFEIFASIIFFSMMVAPSQWWLWIPREFVALGWASRDALKEATGFALFWFLPALFVIVCWRAAIVGGRRLTAVIFILASLVVFFGKGFLPGKYWLSIPWGIDEAGYCLPIGFSVYWLWRKIRHNETARWVTFVVSVVGLAVTYYFMFYFWDGGISIGRLLFPSFRSPLAFLNQTLLLIFAFFVLFLSAPVYQYLPLIHLIGKQSLFIYLAHSFVFQFWVKITPKVAAITGLAADSISLILCGFVFTVAISLALAVVFTRSAKFNQIVFPRSYRQWAPIAGKTVSL
jgi:fucose 4-O-acetylase-like acetyltransferase